jgi:hypothetical protein
MDIEKRQNIPNLDLERDKLRKDERLRVYRESERELEWWGDRLLVNVPEALREGALREVPSEGTGFRLIMTLKNNREPKLLNPQALSLLELIGQKWRDKLTNTSIHDDVFLSVTSLYRSRDLQRQLLRRKANAFSKSSHQAGAAIDFDPNGYYEGSKRVSVKRGDKIFNERHISALKETLEQLENEGKCRVIWEKGFKIVGETVVEYDSCYHVCVKPDAFEL